MHFNTNWEYLPVGEIKEKPNLASYFSNLKFRHYLVFTAILLFIISPVIWLITSESAYGLVSFGLAGILLGIAIRLTPSQKYRDMR